MGLAIMNKKIPKMFPRRLLIKNSLLSLAAVFLLSSCIDIVEVSQPSLVATGSRFTVTVDFITDLDVSEAQSRPKFGAIKLPDGFSVISAVWQAGGTAERSLVYDPVLKAEVTSDYPPAPGYYWWLGSASDSLESSGVLTLTVESGETSGSYFIDYRAGYQNAVPDMVYSDQSLSHGLNVILGADDNDGDGSSNYEEILAGTNPDDATVRPYWWRTFNGDGSDDYLGASVSGAGDVNGDGYADFIAGAYKDDNNGTDSGSARVYSGVDGSVLYTVNGDAYDELGYSVSAAGDVNNDGYDDFIAGVSRDDNNGTDSGSARVYSGVDGSVLYTVYGDSAEDYLGGSVSGVGDVNSDGYADFIAGATHDDNNGTNSGSARVYSGVDGSVLYTVNGDSAGDYLGGSVSGVGDVNNDGYDDFIAGAYGADNNGDASGSARVYSGVDGSVLYTVFGDSALDVLGDSVSGAGDVNSDGYADFIAGAKYDDNNGTNSGSARVYSGVDGTVLYTVYGDSAEDYLGGSVSGTGDVNGDGYADFMAGASYDDNNGDRSGSARVYSGIDGSVLYTVYGDSAGDLLGGSVSGTGDVNGDGYADFIAGASWDDYNGDRSGSVRVFLSSDLLNDADLDFIVNSADPDDDNDGYLDGDDAFPLDASEWLDTDSDGIGNNADWDDDNDGTPDTVDPDPLLDSGVPFPMDSSYKGKSVQQDSVTQ